MALQLVMAPCASFSISMWGVIFHCLRSFFLWVMAAGRLRCAMNGNKPYEVMTPKKNLRAVCKLMFVSYLTTTFSNFIIVFAFMYLRNAHLESGGGRVVEAKHACPDCLRCLKYNTRQIQRHLNQ
jgi:hypothetical protein